VSTGCTAWSTAAAAASLAMTWPNVIQNPLQSQTMNSRRP